MSNFVRRYENETFAHRAHGNFENFGREVSVNLVVSSKHMFFPDILNNSKFDLIRKEDIVRKLENVSG